MKDHFYFFGITRKERGMILEDPLFIKDDAHLVDVDFFGIERMYQKKSLFLPDIEFQKQRGLLFCSGKSIDNNSFLENGIVLVPFTRLLMGSVYCIDEKKIILFKINREVLNIDEAKKLFSELIIPLKIMSFSSFQKEIDKWKEHSLETCESETFRFEQDSFSFCISIFHSFFFSIQIKEDERKMYEDLKKKIKKMYPVPDYETRIVNSKK